MGTRLLAGVLLTTAMLLTSFSCATAIEPEPNSTREPVPSDCGYHTRHFDRRPEPIALDVSYPKNEAEELGEGW
ncbi:MAG: hypothetical protein GC190_09285 [Alphaproteobacteria bacterium]|nr:hypothetical protein [Alphaproteobacteria bacterium]